MKILRPCGSLKEHEAHDSCPGAVNCSYCPCTLWRDEAVNHIQERHASRLLQLNGVTTEPSACQFCREWYDLEDMVEHVQDAHPNRLFVHNGVTTERAECFGVGMVEHKRHLWRLGSKTEFFTCPGTTTCKYCPNLIWCDKMSMHLLQVHTDKFKDPDDDRIAAMVKIMAGTDDDAVKPHPFVTKSTHPDRSVDNLKFCARLDCDRKWSDDIHDPSTFDPADLRTHDEMWALTRRIERSLIRARIEWDAGNEAEGVPLLEFSAGVVAHDLASDPNSLKSDAEECSHPNGFGPNGCAGCGAAAADAYLSTHAALIDANEGFHAWWRKQVDDAAPTIERKAGEYGSNSLAEMGRMFARAQGRERIEDAEALEIGCMVYTKGKIERVLDAMLKGRLPSSDTWHDVMVYSAMSQYIRERGHWY